MSEWSEQKIGDVCELNKNTIHKNYPFDEILYLDTGSITNGRIDILQNLKLKQAPSRAKRIVQNGDIIYSSVRPNQNHFGYLECAEDNLIVSTGFVVLTPKKEIAGKFLYYYITQQWITDYLHSIAEGSTSTYPSLKPEDIANFKVLTPPLQEQQAIAEVLSSLDDKIKLLNRNNKTLEEMAETLFRQWFVEDVKEDWEEVKLGDYIKLESGYSYRSVDLQPSKTALVTLKNFNRNGGFRLDGFKEYTGKYKAEQIVSMGDLVVAHTDITQEADVLGNPAIIIDDGRYDKLIISTDLVKVIPTKFLSKSYLYYLMRQPDFKHYCIGSSNGTTVLHLSKKALPDYEFRLPNVDLVIKFTGLVEPIFEKIGKNIKHINQLETSRDTLLPKLMSGQVRVHV